MAHESRTLVHVTLLPAGIFDICDRFEKFNRGEVFLFLPIEVETERAILNAENASGEEDIFSRLY